MNVFRLELHNLKRGFLLWSLVIASTAFCFMALYPSFKGTDMTAMLDAKTSGFSPEMLKMFGLDTMPDFTVITEFFAYEMQYIALAGGIYAALRGTTALIGEETSGTIEYLYSQPIRRSSIFIEKLFGNFIVFTAYIIVVLVVSEISGMLFKTASAPVGDTLYGIFMVCAAMYLSGLIFLAIGFLFSTLLQSARQITAISIGFVFATYILGLLGKALSGNIKGIGNLRYISPLDYFVPADVMKNGFEIKYIVIGFIVSALSLLAAYGIYQKKDLRS